MIAVMRLRATALVAILFALLVTPAGAAEHALVLDIDGAIGPAIADYVVREIDAAAPKRGRPGRAAHEYAGRPRYLDAPDRQRDPGFAGAGRDLRRAERSARGQRRHLYRLCQRHRGHGARHQYRRRDAGSARRQSAGAGRRLGTENGGARQSRRAGGHGNAQDRQRRGRLYSQPRRAQRPQRRLGRRCGALCREPAGRRSAHASRHRRDRRQRSRSAAPDRRTHGDGRRQAAAAGDRRAANRGGAARLAHRAARASSPIRTSRSSSCSSASTG